MATLVLTAVGTAVGGPIGGAIGAMLGQAVDNATWARPRGREGPRLNALAVQTSSYGTAIPKVFGTMRMAGSVIWSTDLIESRERRSAGKGQPGVTTYSYAASFAVALSARPVRSVGRIWAEGKLLRGAAGDWKTSLGAFRLHPGGEDQGVDPLIASAVADAPAHRGIAYAVFEELQLADFGNRIPSLTFEVIADAAVSVGAVARAIGEGAIVGEGPAVPVAGFAASGDSAAGALETLANVAGAWFKPRGGRMAMVDAAAGAAVALDPDAALTRVRRALETVPVAVSLTYYDPARDWQVGAQPARRPGAGWREEAVTLPAALPAAQARGVAAALLLAREGARERLRVATDMTALALAPGDAVIPAGEARPWRVSSAALEGAGVTLELMPLPATAVALPADAGAPVPAPDVAIGRTLLIAAELPPLTDALPGVPQVTVIAGGTAPGWRSAALMLSRDDGATWEAAGATAAPAVMGVLATPLAAGPTTLVQCVGVELMLAHDAMALQSVDAAALDRGANLAVLGGELVQFRDAVQIAPRRWRVSVLLRGRRGTAATAHAAGTDFALLEADAALVVPVATPGARLRVLARGVGDDDPVEIAVTSNGASVAPPAPVALRVEGDTLRWTRRSRLGWRWSDGVDAPLVEEREAYRVTLSHAEGSRDVIVDAPLLGLDAADRGAGPLHIAVRQLGTLAESVPVAIVI